MSQNSSEVRLMQGQEIPVLFRTQIIEAIVINPHGLREKRPGLGIDLRTMAKYGLLPQETFAKWLESTGKGILELPSGNIAKVLKITGLDGKENFLIEACEWILLSDECNYESRPMKKRLDVHAFYEDAYSRNIDLTDDDVVAIGDWILCCAIHLSMELRWQLKADPC